jgi:hypothetical protein
MRVSIIAALSALTCLTMVSFAFAQNNQGVSRPPDATANPTPPTSCAGRLGRVFRRGFSARREIDDGGRRR